MPTYNEILFQQLEIAPDFLKHVADEEPGTGKKTNRDIINKRLSEAAKAMKGPEGEMFGIQLFLHTATSVVLLQTTEPAKLERTLTEINADPCFEEIDPSVIVTSAALYYLIDEYDRDITAKQIEGDSQESKERRQELKLIQHARKRFNEMNWMMNDNAMQCLFGVDVHETDCLKN